MVLSFKSPRRMVHRADVVIDDQLTPVHIDEIRGINPARENFRVELPDGLIGTSGQYFKPGDYKKFDAFQSKKVKLPVKDVLSFKMSDELDDIVYTRQKRKAGRKPALGSMTGLEHYAYNMKLQQLRRLTKPNVAAMQRRFKTAKLYGNSAVDRMQIPVKPHLYNSKSSLAHTIGKKGEPEVKVNPRWTFMYKPEQTFMLRESHVPRCMVPAKFQIDRNVIPESGKFVRMMENDDTGARAQLRDFFQIGNDFPSNRVTLGIPYKKPSGCFTTPGISRMKLSGCFTTPTISH